MKKKRIADLGPTQLKRLREDVVINSVYLKDYSNRYGVDPQEVADFFTGYLDYIEENMKEDHPCHTDEDFWDLFPQYDNKKNLLDWWFCWVG